MLAVKGVSKSFGSWSVLTDVTFSVKDGQKAALIGPNGVGKSTLLRIIAGLETADTGTIEYLDTRGVAHLPQEIIVESFDVSTFDYLKQRVGLYEVEQRMRLLEKDLGSESALHEYSELQQEFTARHGYEFEVQARKVLTGLGLGDIEEERHVGELSGGQRSKLMLASVLLTDAAVVLLDEPTNNLDLEAIAWLESFITQSHDAFLIVSHDRALLERIVDKVVELDWFTRVATEFTGSYADYLEYRQRQEQRREQQYEAQQEEIARLSASARTGRQWAEVGRYQTGSDNEKMGRGVRRDRAAKSSIRAAATERRLEAIPKITLAKQRELLIIPLETEGGSGTLINADAVAGYVGGFTTKPFNLTLRQGERVGILGANGAGKSTVLKTLTGELPTLAGRVVISQDVVPGILAQAHENVPRIISALAYYRQVVGGDDQAAYTMLARFHILPTDATKLVSELSPGERSRLQLATFAARRVNLLVLDEPTNHLDIDAMDALVEVLRTYRGAVLFVSHDRYFLEQVKDAEMYLLQDGELRRTTETATG